MSKKIVSLFTLVLCFVVTQSAVIAQSQYDKDVYLTNMQKKVKLNWLIPDTSEKNDDFPFITPKKGAAKSAVVSFVVNKDGHVMNADVLRSSGNEEFDRSAVSAVYKSALFGPLADNQNQLNVQFFFSPVLTSITVDDGKPQLRDNKNSNIVDVANVTGNMFVVDYTIDLKNKVESNWQPKSIRKKRNAVVSIEISKDGSLGNVELIKSSHSKIFDRKALDAISKSVPMQNLPRSLNADSKKIQLAFNYTKAHKNCAQEQYVDVNIKTIKGYEKYQEQVEKIISDSLDDKRYYFHKDLVLEICVNKSGRVKYAQIKNPAKYGNFSKKMLAIVQKTSFPPFPEELKLNDVTLNYAIYTQTGTSFYDFLVDNTIHMRRRKLKSYCF